MNLIETQNWSGTIEDGVLKNVKLLGEQSKNNRVYPRATREKAHRFFEGALCNLNHGMDGVESRFGSLSNIREQADGTYGDLHFLTTHPFAATFIEAAKKMPGMYGFSIRATGKVKSKEGKTIVENIDTLTSIDLVASPGTTKGLFEAAEMDQTSDSKSCEQILGELIAALVAEGKEEFVKDAIKLKKKIGGDSESDESPAEPSTEPAPAQESWHADYQRLKLADDCRQLIESHKLVPEKPLLETLTHLDTEEARIKFLEYHKQKSLVKSPKSSPGVTTTITENKKDYAALLRGRI